MDPQPYRLDYKEKSTKSGGFYRNSKMGEQHTKVYIHTLAQYTTHGRGSSAMSALKR